jgi:hypothetical protein
VSGFVCSRCREPVPDKWDRFERRVIYRSVATGRARDQVVEAILCAPCVEAELDARHPRGPAADAAPMF